MILYNAIYKSKMSGNIIKLLVAVFLNVQNSRTSTYEQMEISIVFYHKSHDNSIRYVWLMEKIRISYGHVETHLYCEQATSTYRVGTLLFHNNI